MGPGSFGRIPGCRIAYWISEKLASLFELNPTADSIIALREGIHTGKNELFLREWFEVSLTKMVTTANCYKDIDSSGKWVPYAKGGSYRKWYGNNELIIRFDAASREEMSLLSGHVRPSESLYFKQGATWSALSSGKFGLRLLSPGFLFDSKGQVAIGDKYLEVMTLFNTAAYQQLADVLMPTLDYKCGDVKQLPYCPLPESATELSKECITLSKKDWDAFETSWDFKKHPML